jgi:hypothetical protein
MFAPAGMRAGVHGGRGDCLNATLFGLMLVRRLCVEPLLATSGHRLAPAGHQGGCPVSGAHLGQLLLELFIHFLF